MIKVGDTIYTEKNGEIIRRYPITRVTKLYAFSKRDNGYETKFTREPECIRVVPSDRYSFENYVFGTPEIEQRYKDFLLRGKCFRFLKDCDFHLQTTDQLRRVIEILQEVQQ